MATCKDCLHVDVCRGVYLAVISGKINSYEEFLEKCEKEHFEQQDISLNNCLFYKDRSRFVELPCKAGDVIFCTTMGKIYQGIVGRIELDDEGFAIITADGYCFDSSICYHTQEEAKQALAKRKANNNTPQ